MKKRYRFELAQNPAPMKGTRNDDSCIERRSVDRLAF